MNPLRRYPVLASLLRPFRRSQQKTCAALIAALCQAAQASSFAIAGQLSCLTDVRLGSALTRLYRFLRNDRFDDWLLTEQMLRLLGARPGALLLAPDWTCWQGRFSLLTASACAGTRSIPVAAAACSARNLSRSQNLFEETFLRLCVDRLRAAAVSAIWLCDRGFHRVGWLKLLVGMRQHFVVRLKRDVTVRLPEGARLLKSLALAEGRAARLRVRRATAGRGRPCPPDRHLGEGGEGGLVAGDRLNQCRLEGRGLLRPADGDRGAVPRREGLPLRGEAEVDAVHARQVRRADVPDGRRGALAVDCGGERHRGVGAEGEAAEQAERRAAVAGARRRILLAEGVAAAKTHCQLRTLSPAAAAPEDVQMADGTAKVISGQNLQLKVTYFLRGLENAA